MRSEKSSGGGGVLDVRRAMRVLLLAVGGTGAGRLRAPATTSVAHGADDEGGAGRGDVGRPGAGGRPKRPWCPPSATGRRPRRRLGERRSGAWWPTLTTPTIRRPAGISNAAR